MRTLNLKQGESAWHTHRATARNASDAPAVVGCSPYTTRSELLHQRHTGLRPEVGALTQRRFEDGHAIEASQLPGAEQIVGEALYPVVGVEEVDGIELSASFDGITMAEDVIYECKTINDDLRACMPNPGTDDNDGRDLPKHCRVQCEQQLAVSGAERVLFVAAALDGSDVRRCWYYPDLELRREIIAAWRQFDADLAAYEPRAAAPAAVAAPMESLPAVQVRMDGALTVHSNLGEFAPLLRAFIEKIPAQPSTDQEFADCEAACKALKRVEEELQAEEARALAGMADVEKMRRIVSDLSALARTTRLQREKLVKARKDQLRLEQVQRGRAALAAHLQGLNKTLGGGYMPDVPADFAGVISGKKSLTSIADAIGTELARAKIAANDVAQGIQANLNTLREHAEHQHLFPDERTILLKKPEDLQALVTSRIAAHKAEQERRAAELAERERARIAAEERAKLEREQREKEAAERRLREEAEAAQRRLQQQADPTSAAAPITTEAATNVRPMPTRTPAPTPSHPTLKLNEINRRISPLSIDDAGLTALGFPPAGREGAAKLRHEHAFPAICDALIATIARAKLQQLEAA